MIVLGIRPSIESPPTNVPVRPVPADRRDDTAGGPGRLTPQLSVAAHNDVRPDAQ